jgi:Uncharacterized homolog of plant Iojap protein
MKLEEQLKVVTDTIEELKGEDIITLKVLKQSADIEAIVVTTGRSIQHVRGIANNIKIEAKRLGMKVVGIEGTETGHWVLVDFSGSGCTRDDRKNSRILQAKKDFGLVLSRSDVLI